MPTKEFFPKGGKIRLPDDKLDEIRFDPKLSYLYALNFIKEPFPKGETAIARSAKYSFKYAINVLNDRFPEGERNIKGSNYEDSYKEYFKLKEI